MLLFYGHTSSYGLDIPFCIIMTVFKGLLNEIVNSLMSWPHAYWAAFKIKGIKIKLYMYRLHALLQFPPDGFQQHKYCGFSMK